MEEGGGSGGAGGGVGAGGRGRGGEDGEGQGGVDRGGDVGFKDEREVRVGGVDVAVDVSVEGRMKV